MGGCCNAKSLEAHQINMTARWTLRRLEAAVEGFATQLQCPICLCAYDTPVSLPCNHCFCEECIHRALELKQMCPICKLPARKRHLRYDQMIRQLIAATETLCAPAPAVEQSTAAAAVVGATTPPPTRAQVDRASQNEVPAAAVVDNEQPSPAAPAPVLVLPTLSPGESSAASNETVVIPSEAATDSNEPSPEMHRSANRTGIHAIDELVAESEAINDSMPSAIPMKRETSSGSRAEESADMTDQTNGGAATSSSVVETEAPPLNGPFSAGDVVEVADRTWSGVNKPGGTARIVRVNDDGTYSVKFVVSTRTERKVHDFFIHRLPEEFVSDGAPSRTVKKRQRRSVAESPLSSGQSSAPSSDQKKRVKRSAASATRSPASSTPTQSILSDVVILGSGFEDPETEEIAKSARELGAEVVMQWSSSVTHLIAKCVRADGSEVVAPASRPSSRKMASLSGKRKLFADKPSQQENEEQSQLRDRWVKTRSLKYLKVIAAGRWIVSEHWLEACVRAGDRVDEAPFEADGHYKGRRMHDAVRRARLSREANLRATSPSVNSSTIGTQLFSDFCFHLVGEFLPPMPQAAEVEALLDIGGGRILPSLDDIPLEMKKDENRKRSLVVVCDKINPHTLSKEMNRLSALRQLQNPAPTAVVNYHWVINSISDAKLREFP